jgi:hypothetical protein
MNFILLNLHGGQFTWGYNKRSNEGTIIISFTKVKCTSEGQFVEDDSESISYKPLLEVVIRGFLAFLGLYYLFVVI